MKDKYYTIKEFAQYANVSVQAVYQRVNKDLKNYIIHDNNKMYIKSDALSLFKNNKNKKVIDSNNHNNSNDDNIIINQLYKEIDYLKTNLDKANKDITELRENNTKLQTELIELSKSLIELTKESHILIGQSNLLLSNTSTTNEPDDSTSVSGEPQKKSLWKRIIGR